MLSFTPIHSSPINFTQGSGKRMTPRGPLICGSGGGEEQLKPRLRSIANRKTAQGRISLTSLHRLDRAVAVEHHVAHGFVGDGRVVALLGPDDIGTNISGWFGGILIFENVVLGFQDM